VRQINRNQKKFTATHVFLREEDAEEPKNEDALISCHPDRATCIEAAACRPLPSTARTTPGMARCRTLPLLRADKETGSRDRSTKSMDPTSLSLNSRNTFNLNQS
jgi:hypothetical protein